MKQKEIKDQRSLLVNRITEMLMSQGFTFEYVVRKKPKGIKIIYEVTQEELNAMVEKSKEEKVDYESKM